METGANPITGRRRRLLLALTAGQLILVAVGVVSVDLRQLGPLGVYLDDYRTLSGADSDYGFFAPEVRDQIQTHFEIIDREGRRKPAFLSVGSNHEAEVDIENITDNFESLEPDMRSRLAASLAAQIFADRPEAVRVVVRVERFETVSMEEFRSGIRPQRTPFYEATLTRMEERTGGEPHDTIAH